MTGTRKRPGAPPECIRARAKPQYTKSASQ